MSAPAAIGFSGSNPNNPTGLTVNPLTGQPAPTSGSQPPDPTGYLFIIMQALQALQGKQAPAPQIFLQIAFNGLGIGSVITPSPKPPQQAINKIISNLQRGTVNIYFGQTNANVWDFQFGPTAVPYPIDIPYIQPNVINFECDPSSSTTAFGNIYLCRA